MLSDPLSPPNINNSVDLSDSYACIYHQIVAITWKDLIMKYGCKWIDRPQQEPIRLTDC